MAQNEMWQRLRGRVELHACAALFPFVKDGIVQKAVHKFKYSGYYKVGILWGKHAGKAILESPYFINPDIVIPIPVHFRKLLVRGYNQSRVFGEGVAVETGSRIISDCLIKRRQSNSQTLKGRRDRFRNVLDSFEVKNGKRLEARTILLVDDVMTTGATIEAAVTLLQEIRDIRIQVLIMALAHD